jgi:hypothetical protein
VQHLDRVPLRRQDLGQAAVNVGALVDTAAAQHDAWSTDVTVEPGQGGIVHFRFLDHFNPDMEVTELYENRLVRWKCVDGHDNWLDNTFSFELRPEGSDTGLMFVQEYAKELEDEVYGTYNFNWGYYLGSLKQLCETSSSTPFEPD